MSPAAAAAARSADVAAAQAHGATVIGGYAGGGQVPGKAQVAGNSPRNDTVPARVSPGEIVLPRSVTTAPDAAARAAAFVEAIKKKHGTEEEPEGYARVVAAKKRAKR